MLLQNLQRHFTLTIGAHWRKMRPLEPSWRPVAQFEKNDEKDKNKTMKKNNLKMVLVLRSHTFSSKISKFFKEIGLRLTGFNHLIL